MTEQVQAVDTIQTIMDDEDHHRTSATMTQVAAAALAPSLAVTATGKESLARRLRFMAKELKHFQEMIATEVGIRRGRCEFSTLDIQDYTPESQTTITSRVTEL